MCQILGVTCGIVNVTLQGIATCVPSKCHCLDINLILKYVYLLQYSSVYLFQFSPHYICFNLV